MQEYTDMTFIWSEISFLQLWWDQAHPTKQRALKQLIQSGRFEVNISLDFMLCDVSSF